MALTPAELLDSTYIRYEVWSRFLGDTRSPRTAATSIPGGQAVGNEPVAGELDRFLALADRLSRGLQLPPLILVSAGGGATRVVPEGHRRLTIHPSVPDMIPSETEAIRAASADIARWDEYSKPWPRGSRRVLTPPGGIADDSRGVVRKLTPTTLTDWCRRSTIPQ
jgi:hypothetical protein